MLLRFVRTTSKLRRDATVSRPSNTVLMTLTMLVMMAMMKQLMALLMTMVMVMTWQVSFSIHGENTPFATHSLHEDFSSMTLRLLCVLLPIALAADSILMPVDKALLTVTSDG